MSIPGPAPKIDSHQHFWNPATRDYPWLHDERIARAFSPDDLAPLLATAGIDATVLVQTVPDLDETREFLALAAEHPFIAGVVGWADLADNHLSHVLHGLKDGPGGEYLVGIRHQIESEDDEAWLAREDVQAGIDIVADAGLVYDLLIRPQHLHIALMTALDKPHLRFVIDHMAKPDIANDGFESWNTAIHEFAGLENVACKLSGILTEAGDDRDVETLRPYVRAVVETFGPHRLMIGSDWPVSLLAADYATTLETLRETLSELHLSDDDMDAILGRTAIHWYGLDLSEAADAE